MLLASLSQLRRLVPISIKKQRTEEMKEKGLLLSRETLYRMMKN
jgi:hypothetical protein